MTDAEKIKRLQDALHEARECLLVILSPAIDRQLLPERRQRGHNAIDTAADALNGTGFQKAASK